MINDTLLSEDEQAFESYLDALSMAMQHRSREQPLRDYCTRPAASRWAQERGADRGADRAIRHPDDAQEAVELRVGRGVER